jgi:uncharacterized RDD family membrane protein YckC
VCPRCQKTFAGGTKFCDVDGAKLTSPDKLIPKCVRCEKVYSADTKFCPDDGGAVIPEALRYGQMWLKSDFYPKASLGDRFLASLLDGFFTAMLSLPALIIYFVGMAKLTSYRGEDEAAVLFFFAFFLYIIPLVYSFIKDGLGSGQSWGKRAVGLMVVYLPNNTPCSIGASCLRCLIGSLLCLIPFIGWLIEPIMVLATEDGRRLADKAASTQVIDKKLYTNRTGDLF